MVGARSPRGGAEPRPPSGEWALATNTLVDSGNNARRRAAAVAELSKKVQAQTCKQTAQMHSVVNEKLRKRIRETRSLHTKLVSAITQLTLREREVSEAKALGEARREALRRPLEKGQQRAAIRSQRPAKENLNDKVSRALGAQLRTVQQLLVLLDDYLQKSAQLLNGVRSQLLVLHKDCEDKAASLKVDVACLKAETSDVGEEQDEDLKALLASIPLAPPLPNRSPRRPGGTATAMVIEQQRSEQQTQKWKDTTLFNVQCAKQLAFDAEQLCASIKSALKRIDEADKQAKEAVRDTLTKKVTETSRLNKLLASQLIGVREQLEAVRKQKDAVEEAIKKNEEPALVVRKRLAVRRARPDRERVRDDVEEALEQELRTLTTARDSLEAKFSALMREIARLEAAEAALLKDFTEKQAALELDIDCLDLESVQTSVSASRNANRTVKATTNQADGASPPHADAESTTPLPPIETSPRR